MKKFFKLGKRMLALFIVVLLNINSYAAVGANDGSAFVTKAEFDALVNTFNEQMDTYQSGLNTKIDGAIANYLAGLSSVQVVDVTPIYAPEKGIWSASVDSDSRPWLEGIMEVEGLFSIARIISGTDGFAFKCEFKNNRNPRSYREHLVANFFRYDNKWYADWLGYYESNYKWTVFGADQQTGGISNYYRTNCYIQNLGIREGQKSVNMYTSPTSSGNTNSIYLGGGLLARSSNKVLLDALICAPSDNVSPKYFSRDNIEEQYINKASSDGLDVHTWTGKLSNRYVKVTSSFSTTSTDYSTTDVRFTGNIDNTSMKKNSDDLFYGFSTDVVSYNQLVTDKYGSNIIQELETKGGANIITYDSVKYERVTDGLPLLKVKKGDVVHLPLKFDKINGEYKNIDIWLKNSAFKPDENVKTTTEADIIKGENESNMIASAYSNAITLDAITGNGEGILKFTAVKDGYVFMKWSLAGNECKGGGTFHPQTIKVEKAD